MIFFNSLKMFTLRVPLNSGFGLFHFFFWAVRDAKLIKILFNYVEKVYVSSICAKNKFITNSLLTIKISSQECSNYKQCAVYSVRC